MEIKPSSFLLGLGAALALPFLVKILRPLAVEVVAAGMGIVDEAQRVIAEQMEGIEDIAAEARAKREASMAGALAESDEIPEQTGETTGASGEAGARPRAEARPTAG